MIKTILRLTSAMPICLDNLDKSGSQVLSFFCHNDVGKLSFQMCPLTFGFVK